MIPFRLDVWTAYPDRNELVSATESRRIEPKAMEVLMRLAASPNVVVTKEQLLQDVWKDGHVVEHVLPKTMSALRKALGEDARLIRTVPRRGYMLLIEPASFERRKRPVAALAIAASVSVSLFVGLFDHERHSVALMPTRGADATLARDAEDALVHDLTKFSCLAVTRGGRADYRVESNVIDGGATLRTRLVDGERYVAAIDTPAANGVVGASKVAAGQLVKHVCRKK